MRPDVWLGAALAFALGAGCTESDGAEAPDAGMPAAPDAGGYAWQLPAGFPRPVVPADNPMSEAKVELGRHLFYEKALSREETFSCASCHLQSLAFTDGKAQAVGVTGEVHPRGAQSLVNVGYASVLTWENNLFESLEVQARVPLFGDEPVELGMRGQEDLLVARLQADAEYTTRFEAAFPDDAPAVSLKNVLAALASFERAIISIDSPFDRYSRGEDEALSGPARRGRSLFFSERMECFHCHGGFAFTDAVKHEKTGFVEKPMHVNALYNVDGQGGYPAASRGLIDVSARPEDMGRFKAPTLRNVAVTAPYMHDGSIATLREVIAHYARGGRLVETGPNAGDGALNPRKSEFVRGFEASEQDVTDLIAFLESLTDERLLTDPRFSDPNVP